MRPGLFVRSGATTLKLPLSTISFRKQMADSWRAVTNSATQSVAEQVSYCPKKIARTLLQLIKEE